MLLNNSALVLEGGGMRGAFTAGVLDFLIKHNIRFPYTIGVSAGASNGVSFASRQYRRGYDSNVKLQAVRPFIGLKHFFKGKGFIDLDFLFYEYPRKYNQFDFASYSNSLDRFVIVTSNCITGEAEYHEEKQNHKRLLDLLRASCSLPILCPLTKIDNLPYIDGGVCDAIPFKRALDEGYNRLVIVLTRNEDYRKSETTLHLPPCLYKKYPAIRKKLSNRGARYNRQITQIRKLEKEGKAIVIRPVDPIRVTRTEKNTKKLEALYQQGYHEASVKLMPLIRTQKT